MHKITRTASARAAATFFAAASLLATHLSAAEPTITRTGPTTRITVPLPRTAEAMAFFTLSHDAKQIILLYNNTSQAIDLTTGKLVWTLPYDGEFLYAPDSTRIAVSTSGADMFHTRLSVISAATAVPSFQKEYATLSPVAFSADGKSLICDDRRQGLVILDASTGAEREKIRADQWSKLGTLPAFYRSIANYSPDGNWALHDGKIVNLNTGAESPFPARGQYGADCIFDPHGNLHLVLEFGTAITWHAGDWKEISRVECKEHLDPTAAFHFLPSGDAILVIDSGRIGILDPATGNIRGWTDSSVLRGPMRPRVEFSADGATLAVADGMKNASIEVRPIPGVADLQPPPAVSAPLPRPAIRPDPLPPIPGHQHKDLQSPDWWLDRVADELADSKDPLEKFQVPFTRALLAARKKDAAAASAALKDEETLLDPLGPTGARIMQNSRRQIDAALNGRDQHNRDMFPQSPSSRPASPFQQAAALYHAGKFDEYKKLRQPYLDRVAASQGAHSSETEKLELFLFDLSTGNLETAEAEAPNLPLEDGGWFMLLSQIPEQLPADDLPTLRTIARLAAIHADRALPLVLQPVIQAHIAAGKLEDLLTCIRSFASARNRAAAYLAIIDAIS
ncbi:MAG TPA: WD40 repeat domain-containing protein [Phycisphaerae bacterium]|nr:WD40 repeat domain-containing protein [Phycisphaerae bacterium]